MTRILGLLAILPLLFFAQFSSAQDVHRFGPDQRFDSSLARFLSRPNLPSLRQTAGRPQNSAKKTAAQPALEKIKIPTAAPLAGLPCIDTSLNLITEDPGHNLGIGEDILQTSDGNILVPAYHGQQSSPYTISPALLKYDINGNVVWSKSFDGVYPGNYAISYKAFQLNDGNLLLAGVELIPEPVNGRYEIVLWKLSPTGNVIWQQTDSGSNWTQYSGSLYFTGMAQDPAGNIYLSANDYAFDAITTHSLALKMDPAGNVLWDRAFTYRSSLTFGILYLGGQVSLYGTNPFVYAPDGSGNQTDCIWNLKLNPATGDTIRSRCWYADYGVNSGWNSPFARASVQQLANGNVAIAGTALSDERYGVTQYVHGIAAEFNPSFDFIGGTMIVSNVQSQYSNTRITEHASGRISYTYTPNSGKRTIVGAVMNGQIVKNRVISQVNYPNVWTANFINTSPTGDVLIQTMYDGTLPTNGLEFYRLHDSDTSSLCTGVDTAADWTEPYHMLPYPRFRCDSIASNTFRRTIRTIPLPTPWTPQEQSACKLLSFCDSVKLFVDNPVACAGQPILFTCRRNKECGARPVWSYPQTNLVSDSIFNDSTLRLIYNDQVSEKIRISLSGTCRDLSDSIAFKVLPAEKAISLGPDQYLCRDSTIVLRAGPGYSGYAWQDGSFADTLSVTAPGKYYVTVTNSCGLPVSDTVMIMDGSARTFKVGNDSTYCFLDPVILRAPSGFTGYLWRNDQTSGAAPGQSITVYPTISTTYYASAVSPEGCPMKDTIGIAIDVPARINLGADTSFCSGDSLLLNAGGNFQQYSWNTGATAAAIWVRHAGTYMVRAREADGCYSRDTLVVKSIFSLPVVSLDKDSVLCAGTSRVLDAGNNFKSYLWQDGSTGQKLHANTTGTYFVRVQNSQGCFGADTVAITELKPGPSNFLTTDTLICDGYLSVIRAAPGYRSYLWSTGEKGDSIPTRIAAKYSLTVTDNFGCSATASITVSTKQCLFGIFFPNAFTPNQDGLNDLYKPVVYGHLLRYHLQIFNRWGQRVFDTKDFTRGWNGSTGIMPQGTGSFAWLCTYQFTGGSEKTESGTFVVVR